MKNSAFFLVSVFLLTSCFYSKGEDGFFFSTEKTKEVSGAITEKEFKGDFDRIKVAQSIEAELIKSNEEKVIISAPESVIEEVMVNNDKGELYIHLKPNIRFRKAHQIKAKIFVKDFSVLRATSSATIFTNEKFLQDRTEISASSSGQVKGNYESNNLQIEVSSSGSFSGNIWAKNLESKVSSSGRISAKGNAKNAQISSSSSGDFDGENVTVQHADLSASSSGSIELAVEESLKAKASSSGGIRVKTNGKNINIINSQESSSGRVRIN